MNEIEAGEYARDLETVKDAVADEASGRHDPPYDSTLSIFRDDRDLHDRKIYNAAWREARDK